LSFYSSVVILLGLSPLPPFFLFYIRLHPRDLPSFPTRRSSDLVWPSTHHRWTRTATACAGWRPAVGSPGTWRCTSCEPRGWAGRDRKSTRLNSSHVSISYAVFCLKKKKTKDNKT